MFSQVQLKYAGDKYFVADQVYVKFDINGVVEDIIVIENKLKHSTDLTDNQKAASKISRYTVRNTTERLSQFNTGRTLRNESGVLKFESTIKWYKVWDSNEGDIITDMKKL